MTRKIPVGPFPHYYAIVDDENYEWLSGFGWSALEKRNTGMVYAVLDPPNVVNGTRMMHKILTGFGETDHKNGIGLDNRRTNLRPATPSTNQMNANKRRHTSSKFKGVSWDKERSKWLAYIMKNQRNYRIGRFDNEVDAAEAYDTKARELFGEYARLNFPEEGEQGI